MMKKLGKIILGIIFVLVALSLIVPDSSKETETKSSTTVTSTSQSVEKVSESKTNYDPELSTEAKIENVRSAFQESFAEFGVVRYEPSLKSFILTPTNQGLLSEISQTIEGQKAPDDWIAMVQQNKTASLAVTDSLGTGYSFVIENPYSVGNMIYSIKDGVVTYDGVAEAAGFTY